MKIENEYDFIADSIKISGPRQTDGSFLITFEAGEYMANKISELLKIQRGNCLSVKIKVEK